MTLNDIVQLAAQKEVKFDKDVSILFSMNDDSIPSLITSCDKSINGNLIITVSLTEQFQGLYKIVESSKVIDQED
mgnify:CR=1 FL=1